MKFGVIGVGGMGGSHARSMHQVAEAELTAVADVNLDVARRVGEETNSKPFASAEEMIDSGEVEAIIIATPHFFHPPVTEYAASRGVHVISEKPIAVTVSAADGMIAACQKAGVLLGVMFQQRTDPARLKLKQLIEDGTLGPMHRISMTVPWYRPQAYYNSGAWRGTWKGEGGGILMNQAPHSLDQFVWLGGLPETVQAIARTRLHAIEVENTAAAIFDYGGGKIGWLYVSTAEVPGGERVEVAGDNGLLVLEGNSLRFFQLNEPISEHLMSTDQKFGTPKGTWQDVELDSGHATGHTAVTAAFARAVRTGEPREMIASGEDGRRALELANGILLAGYTRRQTEIPVDRVAFDAMLQKLQEGTKGEDLKQCF